MKQDSCFVFLVRQLSFEKTRLLKFIATLIIRKLEKFQACKSHFAMLVSLAT